MVLDRNAERRRNIFAECGRLKRRHSGLRSLNSRLPTSLPAVHVYPARTNSMLSLPHFSQCVVWPFGSPTA
jgi:hypothetical protein